MSSAGLGERAIVGRRTDQRREDSSDEERWRSPCAGHTHTGQHSSLSQPENFAKVKQIVILHVDHVNQCLEMFFSVFIFD